MTLLDYALRWVDDKLAEIQIAEQRIAAVAPLLTIPALIADAHGRAEALADDRRRLLQQRHALIEEATAYQAAANMRALQAEYDLDWKQVQ